MNLIRRISKLLTTGSNADSLHTHGADGIEENAVGMSEIDDAIKDAADGIPVLDGSGDLVGPIVLHKGTAAVINAIQLPEGQIAYTTDTKTLRIGDGTTMGGNVWSKD